MNYIERGCSSITAMSTETKLGDDRIISIKGLITSETADAFAEQVLILNRQSTEDPVTVLINSAGGSVPQGLMMYDVIQGSVAPIRLVCKGEAYSMAAILLASGNPEHGRYILPNSRVMIHEPLVRGGVEGKSVSIKSISDSLIETRRKLNGILARHTGHTIEEIDEATSYDHYFTAEEAVAYGLCDRVIGFGSLINGMEPCR